MVGEVVQDKNEEPELRLLGGNLHAARARRGLSQTALARHCSLSQAQISYFELGLRRPTLDQFIKLARALDVPLQRLFHGVDRPGVTPRDLAIELRNLGI